MDESINRNLFKELTVSFGKEIRTDIDKITNDCCINGIATLVSEPQGENQYEEYEVIKEVWVDQYSVGMDGDSFEGYIYCKITDKIWLMIPYAM
jgi:hypothetical protein